MCLGRAHTCVLKGVLGEHQRIDGQAVGVQLRDRGNPDPGPVIQALLQKELLVQDERVGKLAVPVSVDAPVASLMDRSRKRRSRVTPAHIWKFLSASASASRDLCWGSIERTVRKIETRKSSHAGDVVTVDDNVIVDLFQIFQALRPYYPRPYLCLFDSLALLHFLALYNVFPQWIYGVKLEPFGAHCWVQTGDLVVNDIIDNVRNYEPIMSV